MAEEGTQGVARALDTNEGTTKADIQRRIGEARESITETVTEIKESVANQYDSFKESVTDVLDWREQVRKRPVAWTVGALGLGIVVGYSLAGLIEEEDKSDDDASERTETAAVEYEVGGPSAFTDHHSYAAHARATARVSNEQADGQVYKPGMIERFKETRAYDRLQDEVGDLGNRFMDELSNAARTIVLPALFNKLKEFIGVDLSKKRKAGGATNQHTSAEPHVSTQSPQSVRHETPDASEGTVTGRSEIGKAAYPISSESRNKFDRPGSDKPTPSDPSDAGPKINLNYDDRYERESKLFSRGDTRGFAPAKPGESKQPVAYIRDTDTDDAPHGADYTFDAGRDADDDTS